MGCRSISVSPQCPQLGPRSPASGYCLSPRKPDEGTLIKVSRSRSVGAYKRPSVRYTNVETVWVCVAVATKAQLKWHERKGCSYGSTGGRTGLTAYKTLGAKIKQPELCEQLASLPFPRDLLQRIQRSITHCEQVTGRHHLMLYFRTISQKDTNCTHYDTKGENTLAHWVLPRGNDVSSCQVVIGKSLEGISLPKDARLEIYKNPL